MEKKENEMFLLCGYLPVRRFRLGVSKKKDYEIVLPSPQNQLRSLVKSSIFKIDGSQAIFSFESNITPQVDTAQPRLSTWTDEKSDNKIYKFSIDRSGSSIFERLYTEDPLVPLQNSLLSNNGYSLSSPEGQKLLENIQSFKKRSEYVVRFGTVFVEDSAGSGIIQNFNDLFRFKDLFSFWKASLGACFVDADRKFKLYSSANIIDNLASYLSLALKQTTWFLKKLLSLDSIILDAGEKEGISTVYLEGIAMNVSKLRYFYRQTMLNPLGVVSGRFKVITGKFDENEKAILRVTVLILESTAKLEKFTVDLVKSWFEGEDVNLSPKVYKLLVWKTLEPDENIQKSIEYNSDAINEYKEAIVYQKQLEEAFPDSLCVLNLAEADNMTELLNRFLDLQFGFDEKSSLDMSQKNPVLNFRCTHVHTKNSRSLLYRGDRRSLHLIDRSGTSPPALISELSNISHLSKHHRSLHVLTADCCLSVIDLDDSLRKGEIIMNQLIDEKFKFVDSIRSSASAVGVFQREEEGEGPAKRLGVYLVDQTQAMEEREMINIDLEKEFQKPVDESKLTVFGKVQSLANENERSKRILAVWSGVVDAESKVYSFEMLLRGILIICTLNKGKRPNKITYRWLKLAGNSYSLEKQTLEINLVNLQSPPFNTPLVFEHNSIPYIFHRPTTANLLDFALFKLTRRSFTLTCRSSSTSSLRSSIKSTISTTNVRWHVNERKSMMLMADCLCRLTMIDVKCCY